MRTGLIAAAVLAATSFATTASAQQGDTGTMATTAPATVEDDDNDFPWGLLGLIGLAGLLGRKRDDRVHTDNTRR